MDDTSARCVTLVTGDDPHRLDRDDDGVACEAC
jgi:hypothetical protein